MVGGRSVLDSETRKPCLPIGRRESGDAMPPHQDAQPAGRVQSEKERTVIQLTHRGKQANAVGNGVCRFNAISSFGNKKGLEKSGQSPGKSCA